MQAQVPAHPSWEWHHYQPERDYPSMLPADCGSGLAHEDGGAYSWYEASVLDHPYHDYEHQRYAADELAEPVSDEFLRQFVVLDDDDDTDAPAFLTDAFPPPSAVAATYHYCSPLSPLPPAAPSFSNATMVRLEDITLQSAASSQSSPAQTPVRRARRLVEIFAAKLRRRIRPPAPSPPPPLHDDEDRMSFLCSPLPPEDEDDVTPLPLHMPRPHPVPRPLVHDLTVSCEKRPVPRAPSSGTRHTLPARGGKAPRTRSVSASPPSRERSRSSSGSVRKRRSLSRPRPVPASSTVVDCFVNYTADDAGQLMTGVAASGSARTKARRDREADDRHRRLSSVAISLLRAAGGDVDQLAAQPDFQV